MPGRRRASGPARSTDEVCVLLMGAALAPAGELARAIAEQRAQVAQATRLTLIPVDARNWDAHMPLDAPAIAKTLLARLKTRDDNRWRGAGGNTGSGRSRLTS